MVPTGFHYNPDTDTIDLVSVGPWRVRGIEIRGEAEVLDTGGSELGWSFAPEMFRITPKRIVSWGAA